MKRIALCADGTWNIRDQVDKATKKRHPSNVTKVARAILPRASNGTDQTVYYHDGVGTAVVLTGLPAEHSAKALKANVRELYRFIVYNYEPDDWPLIAAIRHLRLKGRCMVPARSPAHALS